MTAAFLTLDEAQEKRIAAVHSGFLYQHLFAVGCLLKAQATNVVQVVIERDEDVEIVLPDCRVYVQIKTRSSPLTPSDISTTLERIEKLRLEHTEGRRQGKAIFVVVSNQPPGPKLTRAISRGDIADDVQLPHHEVGLERVGLGAAWAWRLVAFTAAAFHQHLEGLISVVVNNIQALQA